MSGMKALITYAVPIVAFACAVHALLRLRSERSAASAAPCTAASAAAQDEDARARRPAPRATLDGILDAFTHADDGALRSAFAEAQRAVNKSASGALSDSERLQLYGAYKQATEGRNCTKAPMMLDMVASAKWWAWSRMGDTSQEAAMEQYVELVDSLLRRRHSGEQAAAAGEGKAQGTGFGPVFSCMAAEADASRNDGSIHAAAKCGAEAQLARLLDDGAPVDLVDEDGRTPLHWAADLGNAAAVKALLAARADPDVQDSEGMTPLHCAAVCEHRAVCELLVAAGANAHLVDVDGETAAQAMPASWRLG